MSEYVMFSQGGFIDLPWTYEGLFGEESEVERAYQSIGLGASWQKLKACDDGLGGVAVYFASDTVGTPEPVYALIDVMGNGDVLKSIFVETFHDYLLLMNLLSGHLALTVAVGTVEDRQERFANELKQSQGRYLK